MIRLDHIRKLGFLLENYQNRLSSKGVPSDIIQYVDTISNIKIRGEVIARLMSNPHLSLNEIKEFVQSKEVRIHPDKRVHEGLLMADPTKEKKYYNTILGWYGVFANRIPEDADRIRTVLTHYNTHRSRYAHPDDPRKYKEFQDLEQEYSMVSGIVMNAHIITPEGIKSIRGQKPKIVAKKGDWDMWEITTPEQAEFFATKTQWCTKGCSWAQQYLSDGPLYVFVNRKTHEKHQSDYKFHQIMDVKDKSSPQNLVRLFYTMGASTGNVYAFWKKNENPDDPSLYRALEKMTDDRKHRTFLQDPILAQVMSGWGDMYNMSAFTEYIMKHYDHFNPPKRFFIDPGFLLRRALHSYSNKVFIDLADFFVPHPEQLISFLNRPPPVVLPRNTQREKYILSSPKWEVHQIMAYFIKHFPNQRWPELEVLLKKHNKSSFNMMYLAALKEKNIQINTSLEGLQIRSISNVGEFLSAVGYAGGTGERVPAVDKVLKSALTKQEGDKIFWNGAISYMKQFNYYPAEALTLLCSTHPEQGYDLLFSLNKSTMFLRQFHDAFMDALDRIVRFDKSRSEHAPETKNKKDIQACIKYILHMYKGKSDRFCSIMPPEYMFNYRIRTIWIPLATKSTYPYLFSLEDMKRFAESISISLFTPGYKPERRDVIDCVLEYAIAVGDRLSDRLVLNLIRYEGSESHASGDVVGRYLYKFRR